MSKDGWPAFPTGTWGYDALDNPVTFQEGGMTLRDYFAAKAMQAIMGWGDDDANCRTCAMQAYLMADEMLKAREK